MKIIASWSGGKDSCLACYKVIQQRHEVLFLLNFISRETQRGCFHGIDSKLMQAQAEAIGIPLVQKETTPDMKKYEEEFKEAVLELKKARIEGMVFGDVYLDEHKEWVERVCREIGIVPFEPLWHLSSEKIVEEFIGLGFKAIIVSAKADLFEENFVGREIDRDFLEFMKEKKICPCGENGEFHTFVYDGPIFKKRVQIFETQKILISRGFWKHWFLDIRKYKLEGKQ